ALRAVVGHPEGIDEAAYERLHAFTPKLRELCAELDALDGPPPSFDHGDLHPNNVFVDGVNARLHDWGDASLAHPFSSLLVLLRSLREFLDADGVAAVRASYLDGWREDGYAGADLERAVQLAVLVAPILRASSWERVFPCFADADEPNVNAARWLRRLPF
ncbi:MAG: phosphotransferase, partial [Actinocrinis sp.]